LHGFDVDGTRYGIRNPDWDLLDDLDEHRYRLGDVLPSAGSKMRWDYDFGDGWEHDVVVEAIDSPQDGARYPVCLDGKRACPPEDCGGAPGYEELVRVLADLDDPEHEHMLSWAPDGFDASTFDVIAANRRLAAR